MHFSEHIPVVKECTTVYYIHRIEQISTFDGLNELHGNQIMDRKYFDTISSHSIKLSSQITE